jgi:hypothetical protein
MVVGRVAEIPSENEQQSETCSEKVKQIFSGNFQSVHVINVILLCVTFVLTLGYLTVVVGPRNSSFHTAVDSFCTFVLTP